jgi:hypothetical protein
MKLTKQEMNKLLDGMMEMLEPKDIVVPERVLLCHMLKRLEAGADIGKWKPEDLRALGRKHAGNEENIRVTTGRPAAIGMQVNHRRAMKGIIEAATGKTEMENMLAAYLHKHGKSRDEIQRLQDEAIAPTELDEIVETIKMKENAAKPL